MCRPVWILQVAQQHATQKTEKHRRYTGTGSYWKYSSSKPVATMQMMQGPQGMGPVMVLSK